VSPSMTLAWPIRSAVKAALAHATSDNKAAAQYRKAARHKSK
jgi:hypothetical protein